MYPAGTARRQDWRCHNGARAQGFAPPRQKQARPCALRAVVAKPESATGGSGGMRSPTACGLAGPILQNS